MQLLVYLDVPDLERAIQFYGEALGFVVRRRYTGFAEIRKDAMTMLLLEKPAGTAVSPLTEDVRRYERHWCPIHLDFVVDDLDGMLCRALAAGATLEQPVAVANWGKLAVLADPFGHGFCLVQFL